MKKALLALVVGSVAVSALVVAAATPVRPVASLGEILPTERHGVTSVEHVDVPVLVPETVIVARPVARKAAPRVAAYAKRNWHTMDQGPVGRLVRDL